MKLTARRHELLWAVAEGVVERRNNWNATTESVWIDYSGGAYRLRVVTGRIAELQSFGWVELGTLPARWSAPRKWAITPAGRDVLRAAS